MTAPQLLAYIRAALLLQLVVGVAVGVWRRRGDAASLPLAAVVHGSICWLVMGRRVA